MGIRIILHQKRYFEKKSIEDKIFSDRELKLDLKSLSFEKNTKHGMKLILKQR